MIYVAIYKAKFLLISLALNIIFLIWLLIMALSNLSYLLKKMTWYLLVAECRKQQFLHFLALYHNKTYVSWNKWKFDCFLLKVNLIIIYFKIKNEKRYKKKAL